MLAALWCQARIPSWIQQACELMIEYDLSLRQAEGHSIPPLPQRLSHAGIPQKVSKGRCASQALRLSNMPQERVRRDTAELRARLRLLAHDADSTIGASGSGGPAQPRTDSLAVADFPKPTARLSRMCCFLRPPRGAWTTDCFCRSPPGRLPSSPYRTRFRPGVACEEAADRRHP
jgi:hypothetical protein